MAAPPWWSPYVGQFVALAQYAASGLPLRVTSHWRTRASNASAGAGGAKLSQHLIGTAMDFAGPDWACEILMQRARALGLVVIDERNRPGYAPHVHLQAFRAGVVPQGVYTALGVA